MFTVIIGCPRISVGIVHKIAWGHLLGGIITAGLVQLNPGRFNGALPMCGVQVFVHCAGHCTFTPAETLTAFQTLINRLDSGRWDNSTDPALMNQEAIALGPTLNPVPPAFIDFQPTVFLRPFDIRG